MIVYVYRNLKHGRNAKPLYSVMYKGRVVARVSRILLTEASFVVREAGRQRVLRERRKNVHAFVCGKWVRRGGAFGIDANGKDLPVKITYNPYYAGSFFANGPVKSALGVLLNENGISACYID
jgi:hypothetical protein